MPARGGAVQVSMDSPGGTAADRSWREHRLGPAAQPWRPSGGVSLLDMGVGLQPVHEPLEATAKPGRLGRVLSWREVFGWVLRPARPALVLAVRWPPGSVPTGPGLPQFVSLQVPGRGVRIRSDAPAAASTRPRFAAWGDRRTSSPGANERVPGLPAAHAVRHHSALPRIRSRHQGASGSSLRCPVWTGIGQRPRPGPSIRQPAGADRVDLTFPFS